MRHICFRTLLLVLISLFVSGCIVHVRPIPVLKIHPLEIELHD
jgi:hypothetical protein